jgi:molecular chaperone GrpE
VKGSDDGSRPVEEEKETVVAEAEPPVVECESITTAERVDDISSPSQADALSPDAEPEEMEALKEELETWRDRALRLQAEIENFRKRQRRLAEDRIEANRARLLRNFLMIADDLERALNAEGGDETSLREGVEVTQRSLSQFLKQEGVESIEAEGETFDPAWHEAVGTVSPETAGVEQGTVVGVTRTGYRLNGRLLRPARVVVAK